MGLSARIIVSLLVLGAAAPLQAEIYTWTDAAGTVHFTEDLGQVPRKERRKVRRLDEDQPAPARAAETPASGDTGEAPKGAPKDIPAQESEKGQVPDGTQRYGGKSYAQWQKDLADREAAMTAVKQRVEEIAAQVKGGNLRKDAQQKLIEEHGELVRQFNEMKAQYNQQVEAARKAGLQISIQQ